MITFIEMSELLEFSRDLNTERCDFPNDVHREGWRSLYEPTETPTLLSVAADILVKDYVPSSTMFSFYAGYAAGDPQLYPIG